MYIKLGKKKKLCRFVPLLATGLPRFLGGLELETAKFENYSLLSNNFEVVFCILLELMGNNATDGVIQWE